uniref:ribosomal protein S3 n=1 Tax=Fushitsunagia catenata TaxID=1827018 RepID=UPI0026E39EF4|nr:ribosomal protein S3 [Fushitsunagia catenata]WJJ67916.1 ribosomal protein S3 [Fushitsunagia catenata]
MSQKINPINFRLGITQVWNTNFQIYGKSSIIYSNFLHSNLITFQTLSFLYKWTNFLVTDYFTTAVKNKVTINFFYSEKQLITQQNTESLSTLFSNWYNSAVVLNGYPQFQWFYSLGLVINYIQYLLVHNTNKSKVLFDLCSFFENRLGYKKIINSTRGPLLVKLVGFKISLGGRIDNLGNQMAKLVSYKAGVLSLTSTKTVVEFSNSTIYTNLGTCGLQVWLFYKI